MNKQDMLKIQTCVLRVNIHCEGCMHKVKKKLQKVDGVYKVSIDSEQGKVIVSGNADPARLIEKLEKAGKHAELWGGPPQKAMAPVPVFVSGDQLKKFQIESAIKNAKKGNHEQQHKIGSGFVQIPKERELKDEKLFSAKDHKSVKFNLPEEEDEFSDEDDDFDEDDDEFDDDEEFDDEFDDEFTDAHKKPAKAAPAAGAGHKPSKPAPNAHHKGEKDGKPKKGGGGGGGGGGAIDSFLKGMLKKAGRKKGDSDKKSKKGENKKEDGGKNGGFESGEFKKGKNNDGFHGGKQQQKGFNELKVNHKGGGGGGGMNMNMMGQKGGFPSVAGIPAMNGGMFAGGGHGNNPYSQQQQYMAHMMMMNQNGHGGYHPSAYARPPPAAMSYGPPPPGMVYGPAPPMSYGPPPATSEHYTNMFSDENTDSCRIM